MCTSTHKSISFTYRQWNTEMQKKAAKDSATRNSNAVAMSESDDAKAIVGEITSLPTYTDRDKVEQKGLLSDCQKSEQDIEKP